MLIFSGGIIMNQFFTLDKRLGISVPVPEITEEWDKLSKQIQQDILLYWEESRGSIPDRIADLETIINQKQAQLSNENDFILSCKLNSEISELASIINDLWLWFRSNQTISAKTHL
jgi:hypothetical protein